MWCAAEVNPAIPLGPDLEIDQELDVAKVFVRGEIGPLAVVLDHAVLDAPVLLHVLGTCGEKLGLFIRGQGLELARIHGREAVPAGEVLAVEEGYKAVGKVLGGRALAVARLQSP